MLQIVDYSNDPVHGRIGLTKIERDLVRTPSFRRLDRISQLGLGSIVFSGAKHSRASHSLGVLAVASKLCNRLGFDDTESQKIRLAALLHDIGQYPLSHNIEQVYRQIGPSKALSDSIYKDIPPEVAAATTIPYFGRAALRPTGPQYARDKDLAEHVILKRPDLRDVWNHHNYKDDDLLLLARMIRGQSTSTIHKFLLDSEYDCDRLDYIQRDATFAGVQYGLIDLEYLIENMDRRSYPPSSNDEVLTVNRRKALHSFEHFLTGRYYMYTQIIFHRQIKALELLARSAFHALAENGVIYKDFEEIKDIIPSPEFLGFDDGYFWSRVREAQEDSNLDLEIKRICQMVVEHQPPHLSDEEIVLVNVGQDTPGRLDRKRTFLHNEVNLRDLCNRANIPREHLAVEELTVDFLPLAPTISITDVMSGKIDKDEIRMVPWLLDDTNGTINFINEDPGSILSHLAQLRLHILRVFTISSEEQSRAFKRELDQAVRP